MEDEEVSNDMDKPVDESLLMGSDGDDGGDEAPVTDTDDDTPAEAEAEAPEPEGDEAKPDDTQHKEGAVPQARFNQVWAENKAMKERLAELESSGQPAQKQEEPAQTDIKALRRAATAALLEGDTDKHDELQDRIYDELLKQAESQAEVRISKRSEAAEFTKRAAELTAAYPVLDPETGDPEAISLVVELRDAYIAKGVGMTAALEQAVKKIAPRFSPAKVDAHVDEVADKRKEAAVKRGVETNNKIPPQGGGVGNRSMPPNSNANPTQKEWDSMSQAQRDKHLAAAG